MRAIPAKVTSKGQITIPQEVRQRLGLRAGDRVVFRLPEPGDEPAKPGIELEHSGRTAAVAKVPNLLELAGSMTAPKGRRGRPWVDVRETAWEEESRRRA